jgi:hypothetical protein
MEFVQKGQPSGMIVVEEEPDVQQQRAFCKISLGCEAPATSRMPTGDVRDWRLHGMIGAFAIRRTAIGAPVKHSGRTDDDLFRHRV